MQVALKEITGALSVLAGGMYYILLHFFVSFKNE
jgi:hypothetical protein